MIDAVRSDPHIRVEILRGDARQVADGFRNGSVDQATNLVLQALNRTAFDTRVQLI